MFVHVERLLRKLRIGTPQGPLPPRLGVRRTQGRNSQLGEGVLKGPTECRKFPREQKDRVAGPLSHPGPSWPLTPSGQNGVGGGRRQIPARGSDKPAPARRPTGRAPELGVGRRGKDPDRDTPPAKAGRDPERQVGSGQRGAENRGAAECAFVRAVLELVLAGPADRAPASAPGRVHTWRGWGAVGRGS